MSQFLMQNIQQLPIIKCIIVAVSLLLTLCNIYMYQE